MSPPFLCVHQGAIKSLIAPIREASTKEIAINKDAQGFVENKQAAFEGGAVAGNARKELEYKSGKKVISKENYLRLPQNKKLLR